MASPLHIFRRYQKALIAGGIVMLMIAFAITSVPNTLMDRQQRGDPVVFTTRKGEVRERELYGMIEARRLAHRFLYESITLAVRNLMQQRELQSIPPQQIFEILLSGLANDGIELRREIDEESFVRTLIIARKAEEVGISVSDEAINEFLRDRTLKKVTPEQFRQIISDMKISQRTLFDAIRLELLSVRLRQMVFSISAVRGIPPGVRWDYFERLNHRATAQTMGLPVDGFLAQVGEPTEAQLQALYQAHRDDYSFPNSPEPGFHEPEKGKFDYFKADYEKFASTIEVSDADIRDYYEKNKQSQFLYSGFQVAPPKTVEPAKETEPAAEEKAPAPETPESSPAASEAAPSTDAPPSDPPAGDTPGEGPQGNGGDDAGAQEAESSEPAPAAESTASEPAAAVTTPATTPPSEAAPPAEGGEPDSATAASENPPAAADKPADAAAAKPAVPSIEPDESLMLPDSILDGPNPDYEPLWRVEERIRELLRRQRVGDKVRAVFQRLADAVDEYANQLADHELLTQEQGAEKAGPAPQTPDWAKLAAENGVEFASTPLVSPFNVAETELGKSIVNGNQMFAEAAFAALRLRTPRNSADADGNQFLFWKVEEKRDFVPSFEEALEAVTRAWKFQQARELAVKKAQELAQQVNTAGKTLKEVFGDAGTYQVSETGEFSWLTESAARSPDGAPTVPQLTELPGVDRAGSEFMRTVFNLQPPQAGAALNAPQTVAYVVQVTNFSPADVVLRESFMVAPYRTYMGAGLEEERDLVQNWIAQLEQEAGLDWVRPPDQRMQ